MNDKYHNDREEARDIFRDYIDNHNSSILPKPSVTATSGAAQPSIPGNGATTQDPRHGQIYRRLQQVYGPTPGGIARVPSRGNRTKPTTGEYIVERRVVKTPEQAQAPDFSALQRNPGVKGSDAYTELRRKRFSEVQFEALVRNVEPEVAAMMLGYRDDEWG
jgi:hypothetical protein